MPGYDPNLDERIFSKTWESELERLTISVYSYNKGAKKLQIARENMSSQGEFRYAKMGRLTKEELENILPLMQEALQNMD